MTQQLDIHANRRRPKYTVKQTLQRVLWSLCLPLFRHSPRICHGWRAALLRLFGAKVGRNVHVYGSACIYFPWLFEIDDDSTIGENALVYNLGRVRIGKRTTISQRVHLCAGTHDYQDPTMPLLRPPIDIGNEVWVCADAFVGPGIEVGDGAVVAARSVVVTNVEPWMIVAGNPAKPRKRREMHPPHCEGN